MQQTFGHVIGQSTFSEYWWTNGFLADSCGISFPGFKHFHRQLLQQQLERARRDAMPLATGGNAFGRVRP